MFRKQCEGQDGRSSWRLWMLYGERRKKGEDLGRRLEYDSVWVNNEGDSA